MSDICENIERYNPHKEHKILIAFDDMIADTIANMLSSKKLICQPYKTKYFSFYYAISYCCTINY